MCLLPVHNGTHDKIRACYRHVFISVFMKAHYRILGGIKALIWDLIGTLSARRCKATQVNTLLQLKALHQIRSGASQSSIMKNWVFTGEGVGSQLAIRRQFSEHKDHCDAKIVGKPI